MKLFRVENSGRNKITDRQPSAGFNFSCQVMNDDILTIFKDQNF